MQARNQTGDGPDPSGFSARAFADRIAFKFAVQTAATVLALALLAALFPGSISLPPFGQIEYFAALIAFAAILAAINILVRPLLYTLFGPLACLLILLTFGLFHFVFGALLLLLASEVIPGVEVAGFGSALLVSLGTSLASTIASSYFVRDGNFNVRIMRPPN